MSYPSFFALLALVPLALAPAARAQQTTQQPTTLTLTSQQVADRDPADADARDELEVTVSLASGAQPYEVGTFQPLFTFNRDALEFPGQSGDASQGDPADYQFLNYAGSGANAAGETYSYSVNTVTNTFRNEVQVNVALGSTGAGQDVVPAGLPLVRIYFKIKDAAQTAELMWNERDTELLLADNQTLIENSSVMFIGDDGVLPVELVAFDALAGAGVADLSWQTASETGSSGFAVEARLSQSLDARVAAEAAFSERAWVEGAGTTTEQQSYAVRVADLAPGRYAFRLKQVDLDGAFAYSAEVEVTVEAARELRLDTAWPNPARTSARVGFAVPRNGQARVEAYDLAGRLVAVLFEGEAEAGRTLSAEVDASRLASGVYLLRLSFEGEHKTGRLVVTR